MKQTFLKGTLTLFVSSMLNRLLGFIPRLILPRIIGAEGVGLFQLSYPFLILLLTIITGGLPVALAKIIAEEEQSGQHENSRRILRIALKLVISLALICGCICLLSAKWMSVHLFRDERVFYAFLATIPMLFIVGISSVLRGYYQGKHNMTPTAVSQVIETIARLLAVIAMAWLCLPYGLAWAAAGAMSGVVIGECAGFIYLLIYHFNYKKKQQPPILDSTVNRKPSAGLRRLLTLSTPMTANKLVASTAYFFESILIMQSLALAGLETSESTALYGILQGMIIPILVLPNALTYSLSLSLMPAISEAHAQKNWTVIGMRIQQSLKICIVTGIPFAVLTFVFAEQICQFIYHKGDIAYMLQWMAPVALFLYVQGPLQATLQALNRSAVALRNTLIASIIKLSLIYLLASSPELGIIGALLAININIVLTALLHWWSARKYSRLNTRQLQIPAFVLCATMMLVLAYLAQQITDNMSGGWHSLIAPSLAVACYVCFLFAFRILTIEQLRQMLKRSS